MTISAQSEYGPPEGMAELRSDPIFLSQFLTLTLPAIDSIQSAEQTKDKKAREASYMPPSVGSPTPLKHLPKLEAWVGEKTGKGYVEEVKSMVDNMDETENFQHILPPPAFRKDDLPQATMLPTVHLWCIIQAWQPFNRVLHLEEEVSLGGHTKEGRLRGPLQLSDHTPVHSALPFAIPRQVIFRPSEGQKIRGCIIVKEPWVVSLPNLYDSKGELKSLDADSKDATSEALLETLAYLQSAKTTHAILTTYSHFVFIRAEFNEGGELTTVQVSPAVASNDRKATIYAALFYFCRDIAVKE
ncbi:hypothetical protein CBS101457_005650 [Exobasidium rhododendri]|nr:hypothetical protein CBS101457_005650 [Exobasidium rhododendri]